MSGRPSDLSMRGGGVDADDQDDDCAARALTREASQSVAVYPSASDPPPSCRGWLEKKSGGKEGQHKASCSRNGSGATADDRL